MSEYQDMLDTKKLWADAANRRLETMRKPGLGSYNPVPYLEESAADQALKAQERGQDPTNQAGPKQTTARLLDWEHAANQAQQAQAPLPSFDSGARLNTNYPK